ncbi:MAG: efflux RND transporter permease subunit, partial [Gammaproteobacteria bacterium]|nr:efflux RND transporter permease subunit [Gammaproteobacteria bacterium]
TTVPPPTVMKGNDNDDPAVVLSVTSKTRNSMDVTDYVMRYIQPELQQIPGVSNAEIWGQRSYAMRIMLNPLKMAAHGVTVTDINNALAAQNVYVPSGQIKSFSRYYPITTEANINTAAQFQNLILKSNNGYITRFGDVADISIGPEDTDSAFRINGKSAIALGVIPDSTANPIDVSDDVKSILDKLQSNLPSDMHIAVLFDNSKFIAASLNEVYRAIVEALLLVTLVIFLFLGSWRATLIPVITIPVCLIATFAILYGFGYSVNIITLLALVLAIGLVVDDAIVMLENIHRHIEMGEKPFAAAIIGSKEIVFAIIAMTLTLVAVYLPTGFTQGLTGILFSQFAVTLAGAVLISGFIALTLSPMMSSRILAAHAAEGRYSRWLEKSLGRLTEGYKRLLSYALYHRILVVLLLLLFGLLGYWMYQGMPSELAPVEDQDYIMGVINPPEQASFAYSDHYARMVQKIYETNPNITGSFMIVGDGGDASQIYSFAILKPQEDRKDTQQTISTQLQTEMNQIAGVEAFPVIPAPLGQHTSSHRSLEIVLMNSGTLPHLISVADQFASDISKYPGLTNVQNTTTLNSRLV